MKKILYLLCGVALMSLASCWAVDNWDAPDCRFYGKVIDSYTGENILTSQNEFKIRMYETSWTAREATNQDLVVKQDGTYNNSKLFAATFKMVPYDGPFWPADTIFNVELKKETEQNFTVTPYLQIVNFHYDVTTENFGTATDPVMAPGITLYCQLKAPKRENLPNLREIRPYLSLLPFCGETSYISITEYINNNTARIQLNRSWAAEMQRTGLDSNSEISIEYKSGPLRVKPGYTYYVRMGANVTSGNNRFCYSPIVKVVVP